MQIYKLYTAIWMLGSLLLWGEGLHAQNWSQVSTFGGDGNESLQNSCLNAAGEVLLSGNFSAPFTLAGEEIPHFSETDVFLAVLSPELELRWAIHGGSSDDDKAGPIAIGPDQSVFWAGFFWDEATIGGQSLGAPLAGKTLFLFKYSAEGNLLWHQSIHGTGEKEIKALTTDDQGNLYAIGDFSQNLLFEDQSLDLGEQKGIFLAKWASNGELIWATAFPGKGEVKSKALEIQGPQLYACGNYNDTLSFGNELLIAESFDEDGFLIALDTSGQPQWSRTIGAQYNDFANDLSIQPDNTIVVVGSFMGVLRISPELEVQTPGFNHDIFEARFSIDGIPLGLRREGALGDEFAIGLWGNANSILITGTHSDEWTLGNSTLPAAQGTRSGYVANFNPEGVPYWLLDIAGTTFVLPHQVLRDNQGNVWVTGSFNGSLHLDDTLYPSAGAFDIFLLAVNPLTVSNTDVPDPVGYTIFPNPNNGSLQINGPLPVLIEVVDEKGEVLVQQLLRDPVIDLSSLPKGLYYLRLFKEQFEATQVLPFVLEH